MRQALYTLGFHDVYHMQTLIGDPSRADLWTKAVLAKYLPDTDLSKPEFATEDWDQLLGDCQGVCDIPPAFFGAELAEHYPDAKVVIMNRDPEKWYYSVLGSTYRLTQPREPWMKLRMGFCALFDKNMWGMMRFVKAMNKHALGGYDHGKDKDRAIAWFNGQYEEFRDRIPEERRIEYAITDGWGPLCEHLGVPVPTATDPETGETKTAPFPRLNDQEFFQQRGELLISKSVSKAWANVVDVIGKLGFLVALGYGASVLAGHRGRSFPW
ncbi:hypothetical protein MKZ38_004277 [Zalerion maritima]|uniref:Sulfotransferase n=1 Tax=Zalerion maritima TaxID=339359 RepID=A0AAD5WR44_9PEZI|nr:hypothetical protein MKZ38_004277 [Zalerion maritima]